MSRPRLGQIHIGEHARLGTETLTAASVIPRRQLPALQPMKIQTATMPELSALASELDITESISAD